MTFSIGTANLIRKQIKIVNMYTGVQSINNVFHIVDKVENVLENT
jgi:hypothetical protein